MFTICELVTFDPEGPSDDVPDEWRYSPSHFGKSIEEDDHLLEELRTMWRDADVTYDSLIAYGQILSRYLKMLEAKGLSY